MYLAWPYLDMSTTQADLVNVAVLATHLAFAAAFGCLAVVSRSAEAAVASDAAETFRWLGVGLFPVILGLDWFLGWAADHMTVGVGEFIFGQGPSRPVSRVIECELD